MFNGLADRRHFLENAVAAHWGNSSGTSFSEIFARHPSLSRFYAQGSQLATLDSLENTKRSKYLRLVEGRLSVVLGRLSELCWKEMVDETQTCTREVGSFLNQWLSRNNST
jgi:hypothetical protein